MINKLNYISIILIVLIPISLITGPAIPDISISLVGFFFLISCALTGTYKDIIKNSIVKYSIFFWLFLLFSVIFVSLDSLYQLINYDPEFGFGKDIFGFKPNWYGRLTGPFYNELIPGAYVSKFGLIGLSSILINIKNLNKQKLLSIIYLTLIGLVTFVSGERMAFATLMLGIIFLSIFYQNKRLTFIYSSVTIIVTCFVINIVHPIYNDYKVIESKPTHLGLKVEKYYKCKDNKEIICNKIIYLQPSFLEIIKNFDQSAYGQIYLLALEMFRDHKVSGIGLNNFTYLCKNDERYKNFMDSSNCPSHPHNIYLQWLTETGLIGLIVFIFYSQILKNDFNNYSLIALSSLLILFWPIMSTGSLLKNWNGVSTFFIIGICLVLNKLKTKN